MWSRYKVRKVHQIPIVERMWQAIAQQIAALLQIVGGDKLIIPFC